MWNLIYKWICLLFPIVIVWSLVILYYNAFIFNSDTYYLIDFESSFDFLINAHLFNFDLPNFINQWSEGFSKLANLFDFVNMEGIGGIGGTLLLIYNALNYIMSLIGYLYTVVGYAVALVVELFLIICKVIYLILNPIFYDSGIKKSFIAGASLLLNF